MVKPRHEIKVFITLADYISIKNRLKTFATLDKNAGDSGIYHIRSLYFDNFNDKALMEKISGINNREKFRIRFYNHNHSFIRLEKKSKSNGLCYKSSATLTKEECEKILNGDIEFLKDSNKDVLKEFYCKLKYQCLKPKTIVDYTREAYIFNAGNVRITFDYNIKSGLYSTNIFDPNLPTLGLVNDNPIILEIKYDNFFPDIIRDLVQTNTRRQTAVSKYAACRLFTV
ncbi:polyphosphate polymerase domain-containing protein [Clostridium sp. Sa3CUN1]|uniref:Polyphosphate polymerase domain-containing protein n=1 Tax=Clostridium gallinarum TaxID=2762246 RepID=A0ABR8Q1S1_9CLOT|nr:polyphosphate polymerase domain-containing protein [Clostridium gallinarum]MBD7914355.1 polyphosphate polymerase domain-containing protein [Clostridium gallinarum]